MDAIKKAGLTFKEAFEVLKGGGCVKRVGWLGYWVIERTSRTSGCESVAMYYEDGRIVDMCFGCDSVSTLSNCCADDWMIVDDRQRKELDKVRESRVLVPSEEAK